MTIKILYLTHDLADPTTHKRVTMLVSGGAAVTVAGFRRREEPVDNVAGCRAVDFGRTYNAGFMQRLGSVLREVANLGKHRQLFAEADIIIARNLEMLAIGVRGRSLCRVPPVLVYECLDIHRLLLDKGPTSFSLRALEGWLAKRASALITSSPAFVREYFDRISHVRLPVRLVENKMYVPGLKAVTPERKAGKPWKIGWFGAIRCRKSLAILTELVRRSNGSIEVIIRGKPSLDQFDDFHKQTTGIPGLQFLGPYKNPDDLAAIYGEVHFTWAIDMFEEGLNSSWLLPNRLYEGGAFASVPIAAEAVETGRFLKILGIGVTIGEPKGEYLERFFATLTPTGYTALESVVRAAPETTWICGKQDCIDLVAYLAGLKP